MFTHPYGAPLADRESFSDVPTAPLLEKSFEPFMATPEGFTVWPWVRSIPAAQGVIV